MTRFHDAAIVVGILSHGLGPRTINVTGLVPRLYDPPVIVGVFAHRVVMLRSATAAGLSRFVLLMCMSRG